MTKVMARKASSPTVKKTSKAKPRKQTKTKVAGEPKKLTRYQSMRDFGLTPEPSGNAPMPRSRQMSFVVQKHAASRLHYDFRLELGGVLLSWSVPKGPSLSPDVKRLAVRTEDHPLAYAAFEGIIPKGQYGGGTVVVWDRGTWEAEGDAETAVKKGRLTFSLFGEKLTGRWHLVRAYGRESKTENWLLFKGTDEVANKKIDIVKEQPQSVLSGRTIEEVAADPERVWHSNRSEKNLEAPPSKEKLPTDLQELIRKMSGDVKLTNLDKILYPDHGLTKGELIAYLAIASSWMLPHVAKRPLTLVRCPNGQDKQCFYQKHAKEGLPSQIGRVEIPSSGGEVDEYMQVSDLPGVFAIAQLGTLEIHTWGCHIDKLERPDLLVFDLDPDVGLDWERVVEGAFELRTRLKKSGLESFVKTTGGKGLHVVAPISRRVDWDAFKTFSKHLADSMEADSPNLYTSNPLKARRRGKVFIDYLRNGRGSTFIAPYSPRARPGAPVAVPLSWDELTPDLNPSLFTIRTMPARFNAVGEDPWLPMLSVKQNLK